MEILLLVVQLADGDTSYPVGSEIHRSSEVVYTSIIKWERLDALEKVKIACVIALHFW